MPNVISQNLNNYGIIQNFTQQNQGISTINKKKHMN
jgi:hypothetical protein